MIPWHCNLKHCLENMDFLEHCSGKQKSIEIPFFLLSLTSKNPFLVPELCKTAFYIL